MCCILLLYLDVMSHYLLIYSFSFPRSCEMAQWCFFNQTSCPILHSFACFCLRKQKQTQKPNFVCLVIIHVLSINTIYYYPHMPISKVHRLLFVFFVCTVTDFSTEDKASGVKFCKAVHWRSRQGIFHFYEVCSPEAHNRTNLPARHHLHDDHNDYPLAPEHMTAYGMWM